jgi:hypothetical protein
MVPGLCQLEVIQKLLGTKDRSGRQNNYVPVPVSVVFCGLPPSSDTLRKARLTPVVLGLKDKVDPAASASPKGIAARVLLNSEVNRIRPRNRNFLDVK